MPIQFVHGVGPQRGELLGRIGVQTVSDALFLFPRDYRDLSDLRSIDALEEDRLQSVDGTVAEVELRSLGPGRSLVGVLLNEGGHHLRAMWFNQAFMREKFTVGQRLRLAGKPRFRGGRWQMNHPRVTFLDQADSPSDTKLLPVYPLTDCLGQHEIRRLVRRVVDQYAGSVDEVFPPALRDAYDLLPIAEALPKIHYPADSNELARARRRFVFQELFVLQLALARQRTQRRAGRGAAAMPSTAQIDSRIRRLFPFEWTAAQQQAIGEIAADMARPWPMNRLLQGDVGSGKTVAAIYAMLLCVAHGHQAVLMVPTEILARQHAETLAGYLSAARVRRVLLAGGLNDAERHAMLGRIAAGEVDLVIATQAVLQDDVTFARLALVVIDEQHKFGVRQRAGLRQAGVDPHYLVMTATPIPRSVTMTLFGDLDLSTLRSGPPGRQPVHTYFVTPDQQSRWWEFVGKKLREGRQGYVIMPLVEESQRSDQRSVEEAFEALANGPLEAFRLGLIHGRMKTAEKDAAMTTFHTGEIQLLIATSVVEVGVDVPNATIMTIDGADQFGLAQLHQLRGRISRGRFSGYCGVMADPQTDQARSRLDAFVATTDGFELAEADFRLRGPGDLLGVRQHGLPPLRIASLSDDLPLLVEARREAQRLTDKDPELTAPELARLRHMVLARYGKTLELGDAG
jgi:ATP-dependent DNA helicase RecG